MSSKGWRCSTNVGRPGVISVSCCGELGGVPAVEELVEVGVAVEVVEVLEQREVERLLQHRVRLVPCEPRRQVDGDLLVADGRLERRLVAGVQAVDRLLLLLVDAPRQRQRALDLGVVGVAGELVGEHDRLDLDPVHQDHARAACRVDGVLVVRLDVQFGPAAQLFLDRDALLRRVDRRPWDAPWVGGSSSLVLRPSRQHPRSGYLRRSRRRLVNLEAYRSCCSTRCGSPAMFASFNECLRDARRCR